MITEYVAAAMRQSEAEQMENGRYFATIPVCKGCWAEGATVEECRAELPEVLESWLIVRLRRGLEIPVIEGIDLNPKLAYAEAD